MVVGLCVVVGVYVTYLLLSCSQIAYPFVHEVPFITLATPGIDLRHSATLGNVLNPSYVPNIVVTTPFPMSLWQRLQNTAMSIYFFYWKNWVLFPQIETEVWWKIIYFAHFRSIQPQFLP